jgi:hypothetical protein
MSELMINRIKTVQDLFLSLTVPYASDAASLITPRPLRTITYGRALTTHPLNDFFLLGLQCSLLASAYLSESATHEGLAPIFAHQGTRFIRGSILWPTSLKLQYIRAPYKSIICCAMLMILSRPDVVLTSLSEDV